MVNILAPVVTTGPTYFKVANFPGLYRHSRSGRYYACKKQGGIRWERSLGTCDRKIAERRLKEWIGNLDKVDAEVEKTTLGQLIQRFVVVTGGMFTHFGYQNNGRITDVWHFHVDANGNQSTNVSRHAYGYAPDGRISWFDREADGGQSGSSLENGRGDVYDYYPDGSLHYGARDVACTGGWPGIFNATADSRVADGNVSYANASASTYGFGYNYDAAGNRTSVSQMNQPAIGYGDNGLGENQYFGSAYDARGNTTNSAVGWTYAYNADNQLKRLSKK